MYPSLSNPFEIIVGTYEQYLLGYKVQNIVNEYQVEKSFATHSHLASVRSVASNKRYLASAGADETVCLYDMRQRRESGKLMHHTDTINCVTFTPEGSHLFTCSKDGSIGAIRCGNWQMEKLWPTAHKGSAVNTLAIHPSGKLALSTGEDGTLRTWNLIKGRQAYAINLVPTLKNEAKWITIVKWSPSGEKYLLAVNQNIYMYSVETAGIDNKLVFDSKVVCVEFLTEDLIAVGFENGKIVFYDLKSSEHTVNTKAHNMRVKCISHMNDLLVSASSSGEIKLWRYDTHGLNMLKAVNCGTRITCLSLAEVCKDLKPEKELKLDEEEENEEEIKKSKVRLRQEVIIENEDELEVIGITNPKVKASKTKHKKKRAIEDTEDDVQNSKKKILKSKEVVQKKKRNRSLDVEEVAKSKKKKKLLPPETSPPKKRKENGSAPQATLPAKKIKKTDKVEESSLPHKRHKIKSPMTDAPLKKTRSKVKGEGIVPKKKKKKLMK
nr:PREDICTED: p21-activated protein kinase-interacting protein 1-like [Linepithema humile]